MNAICTYPFTARVLWESMGKSQHEAVTLVLYEMWSRIANAHNPFTAQVLGESMGESQHEAAMLGPALKIRKSGHDSLEGERSTSDDDVNDMVCGGGGGSGGVGENLGVGVGGGVGVVMDVGVGVGVDFGYNAISFLM